MTRPGVDVAVDPQTAADHNAGIISRGQKCFHSVGQECDLPPTIGNPNFIGTDSMPLIVKRIYDAAAALFCIGLVVAFTPPVWRGHIAVDWWCLLAGGAGIAFWGRRTRIWACALGGGFAMSGAVGIEIYSYYRRLEDEGRPAALIADDPLGDTLEVYSWFVPGVVAGALIAAIGRGLFDPGFLTNWNWPAHEPAENKTAGEHRPGRTGSAS